MWCEIGRRSSVHSFAFTCIRLYSHRGLVWCYPYKAEKPDNAVKQQDRYTFLMVRSKIVINRLNGAVWRLDSGNSNTLTTCRSCLVERLGVGKYCLVAGSNAVAYVIETYRQNLPTMAINAYQVNIAYQ